MDLDEYWKERGGIVYKGGNGVVPTIPPKSQPATPSPAPKKVSSDEKQDLRVFVSGIPLGMEWQDLKDLFREKVMIIK